MTRESQLTVGHPDPPHREMPGRCGIRGEVLPVFLTPNWAGTGVWSHGPFVCVYSIDVLDSMSPDADADTVNN